VASSAYRRSERVQRLEDLRACLPQLILPVLPCVRAARREVEGSRDAERRQLELERAGLGEGQRLERHAVGGVVVADEALRVVVLTGQTAGGRDVQRQTLELRS